MIKLLLLSLALLFTSCVNKRGISTKYYNDCHEYYDYQGTYHKVCDENEILEKKTLTDAPGKIIDFFLDDGNQREEERNVW